MSSPPEPSHSQIDPSLTSAVSTLISSFSALSIESHREEEVVESGASKVLKEGAFLLDNEVHISATQVVKRKQRTFWAFAHGEVIQSRITQQAGCAVNIKMWEESSYILLHQQLGWANI